ncbi:Adenine deaminase [Clostridium sp. IBUN22A]|uniref:adenine deaminase n=1 Tax=Clostridium sp. IBUN22A TaxID=1523155 RepID=UPI0005FAE18F|nr:adenine deaminase [Clostridium sp. IBUN22A]KJZ96314.1 Adenine deaminase [Clostridium sp. IBUN22A]
MTKQTFIEQIKASTKSIKCDLVIKNINIVDVFNKNTFIDSIGIKNGYIVGIGDYEGTETFDGTNKYICPGLIDAHCHIESSLTSPAEYYKAALLNGITSVIADPHEIANVLGLDGIKFMLDSSENIPFDMYFMLPSCVPGTEFENSGAVLNAKDLESLYKNERILGLAEVMNYPGVINCNEDIINKLYDAINNNKIIDGHGAGLTPMMINSYRCANISTDHECISKEEALEKIRRGMHVLIREGTVAKNLKELLPAVNESNSSRFSLCTDDKHIDDLMKNGSINTSIIEAINFGLKPETAISMASINTSSLYNIKNKGAIAPGYIADFIILDDLTSFKINRVYKKGLLVVDKSKLLTSIPIKHTLKNLKITNSINIPILSKDSFKVSLTNDSAKKINIIEIIPNKLETKHLQYNQSDLYNQNVNTSGTFNFESYLKNDLVKIAVIERHKATGNIGLGILKGLGLKCGAIATTIAHDSHNLIQAGTNDNDMLFAVQELKKIGGGIIVVQNEKILSSIKLEIAGLMTSRSYSEIDFELESLHNSIKIVAPNINFNPFLTLSFLSLPVIPSIKITDKGLFDVTNFKFIKIIE